MKSKPSYTSLAYPPKRQWMNYTTNRTLRLQSIYPTILPAKGKMDRTIKTVIVSIFKIYGSITKK